MANNDELSDLISEASSEVDTAIDKALKKKRRKRSMSGLKPLVPVVILACAYLLFDAQQSSPPDSAVVRAELTILLQEAEASVEAAAAGGRLPPILPNAALGAVVSYAPYADGGGYFLSAQSHGIVAELNSGGQITIRQNN